MWYHVDGAGEIDSCLQVRMHSRDHICICLCMRQGVSNTNADMGCRDRACDSTGLHRANRFVIPVLLKAVPNI